MIKLKEIYNKILEQVEPKKYTLYCDMDGVLCDFEARFKDLTGLSPNAFRDKNGLDEFWKVIDKDGVRFWVGMDWMPDGKQLYDYIKPNLYSLLSSPSYDNSSRLGKRLWVKKNTPGTKLILAAAEKALYYGIKEFTKNNYGFSNVEIQKLKRLYDYAIGLDDFNTKKYRKDFVKFVDEYDNRRGTNFLETFPQFTELYAENK